jgi:hypothetical protein
MKYAVEMGSDAMIYIQSFIKIGSGIRKLIRGIHRQHGDRISLLQESRLKMKQEVLGRSNHLLSFDTTRTA